MRNSGWDTLIRSRYYRTSHVQTQLSDSPNILWNVTVCLALYTSCSPCFGLETVLEAECDLSSIEIEGGVAALVSTESESTFRSLVNVLPSGHIDEVAQLTDACEGRVRSSRSSTGGALDHECGGSV